MEARYIRPESIAAGDYIRVTDEFDDVKKHTEGKVHGIEYQGNVRVVFTAAGHELLRWVPGQTCSRVTLLDRKPLTEQPALFGEMFETMGERI